MAHKSSGSCGCSLQSPSPLCCTTKSAGNLSCFLFTNIAGRLEVCLLQELLVQIYICFFFWQIRLYKLNLSGLPKKNTPTESKKKLSPDAAVQFFNQGRNATISAFFVFFGNTVFLDYCEKYCACKLIFI